MTYIQITTKCNMRCRHCCMSCEPGKGEHMPMKVYKEALAWAGNYGGCIFLGGGEPTLHPRFWEILGRAMAEAEDGVWLATNGSVTSTALALAKMAKSGVIGCALSQDIFHDAIDDVVVQAFSQAGRNDGTDQREIRSVKSVARCDRIDGDPEFEFDTGFEIKDYCACEGAMIDVNGDIKMCGCLGSPKIGDVWRGVHDDVVKLALQLNGDNTDTFGYPPCLSDLENFCGRKMSAKDKAKLESAVRRINRKGVATNV